MKLQIMASTPVVREAARKDIQTLIGRDPPHTCRAWVAVLDGEVVGLAGYYLPGGPPIVFSQITDGLRPHRKFIVRIARDFMAMMPSPILAVASRKEPTSERFLKWLGFEWVRSDDVGEVYQWQTP